jgi:CheY-like chemotaxis protein
MSTPKLFVIEDDADIRSAIAETLEMEGYAVETYANGREGLEALRKNEQPGLILLDLMMPVMNGWEFMRARRHLGDGAASVPVFVFSAVADKSVVQDYGAAGYLKKPLDAEALLKVVRAKCGPPSQAA